MLVVVVVVVVVVQLVFLDVVDPFSLLHLGDAHSGCCTLLVPFRMLRSLNSQTLVGKMPTKMECNHLVGTLPPSCYQALDVDVPLKQIDALP